MMDGRMNYWIACARCKPFSIGLQALEQIDRAPLTQIQIACLSGWLRDFPGQTIVREDLAKLRALTPLLIAEQANRLLQHLARQYPQPGEKFVASLVDPVSQAVAWAHGESHMGYLIRDYLVAGVGYLALQNTNIIDGGYRVGITPIGWKHLEDLRSINPDSPHGFVAMWFDDTTLELRTRGLIRGIEDAGYETLLVDRYPSNNLIIDEIIAGIRRSRLVVADFTGQRGGVYFEAGFAQGLSLPVVRTCRKDDVRNLHFDVNHYKFLVWEPEHLDRFASELTFHIEATVGRGPVIRRS
jgi:hypothetical protein